MISRSVSLSHGKGEMISTSKDSYGLHGDDLIKHSVATQCLTSIMCSINIGRH